MTNETRMTKSEIVRRTPRSFVIRALSFIRHSSFVLRHLPSHLLRHLDPEQLEALGQNPRRQLAKRETGAACGLLRLQNRAGFVKRVEAVGQLEEIICQNVRPEIVQNRWNDFAELTKPEGQIPFFRRGQHEFLRRDKLFARFPKNRADADVGVLQVRCRVPLERSQEKM